MTLWRARPRRRLILDTLIPAILACLLVGWVLSVHPLEKLTLKLLIDVLRMHEVTEATALTFAFVVLPTP
jgi:hypothetical protein